MSLLKKYLNKYFIETGSYNGDGIQRALDDGFKNIVSIEITPKYYEICKERFKDEKNVEIVFGDSAKVLVEVMKKIKFPITIFLDAHYTEPSTLFSDVGWFPLLHELDLIKKHKIKNHTIIVDDVRCFKESYVYFNNCLITEQDIKNKILEINPKYKFSYEDGIIPNDILVARI